MGYPGVKEGLVRTQDQFASHLVAPRWAWSAQSLGRYLW